MSTQASKLLIQLKQKKTKKPLSFEQLICILNHGAIKPPQVKRYLVQVHNINKQPLNWLELEFQKIQQMSEESYLYILERRQQWKQEQQRKKRQEEQRKKMQQELQRLRREMIKRNLTRQKMIEMCKDSIQRCERILDVGVSDPEEYERINQTVSQLKKQLLILQGNYFEELREQGVQPLIQQDNTELYQIIEEIRQKKRRQQRQRIQKMEKVNRQLRESYVNKFRKIIRRMRDIYQYYSKIMYTPGTTFQDNSKLLRLMDMKVFTKYLKDFQFNMFKEITGDVDLKNQKESQILSKIKNQQMIRERKSNQNIKKATNLFKAIAEHGIWMNFSKFVEFHFQLIESKQNLGSQDLKYVILKEQQEMLIQLGIIANKKSSKTQPFDQLKQIVGKVAKEMKNEKQGKQSIYEKIDNIDKLQRILTKQKIQKVLRIGLSEQAFKPKKKSRIDSVIRHIQTDQKQNLIQKINQRIEQRKKEDQVLKQKIAAAKRMFQENKDKRLRKYTAQQQIPYQNRHHKLQHANSQYLKPISSDKLKALINKHEQNIKSKQLDSYVVNQPLKIQNKVSSLPKLTYGKNPESIYQSLRKFKIENLMLQQEVNLLISTSLLSKQKQTGVDASEKNRNWANQQDQQYLSELFIRQRKNKRKNKQKISSGKSIKTVNPEEKSSSAKKIRLDIQSQQPRMRFT